MCGVKRSCFIYIFIQIFSGDERQIKRLKMLKNAVWKQEKKNLTFLSLLGKPKKRIASGNLSVILQSASCSCFCMFLLPWEPGQGGKGLLSRWHPVWPCRTEPRARGWCSGPARCRAGSLGHGARWGKGWHSGAVLWGRLWSCVVSDKSQKLEWSTENTFFSLRENRRTCVTSQFT